MPEMSNQHEVDCSNIVMYSSLHNVGDLLFAIIRKYNAIENMKWPSIFPLFKDIRKVDLYMWSIFNKR